MNNNSKKQKKKQLFLLCFGPFVFLTIFILIPNEPIKAIQLIFQKKQFAKHSTITPWIQQIVQNNERDQQQKNCINLLKTKSFKCNKLKEYEMKTVSEIWALK